MWPSKLSTLKNNTRIALIQVDNLKYFYEFRAFLKVTTKLWPCENGKKHLNRTKIIWVNGVQYFFLGLTVDCASPLQRYFTEQTNYLRTNVQWECLLRHNNNNRKKCIFSFLFSSGDNFFLSFRLFVIRSQLEEKVNGIDMSAPTNAVICLWTDDETTNERIVCWDVQHIFFRVV